MMSDTKGCSLTSLSQELLCHILSFLPLREILRLGTLNKNLYAASKLHLCLLKEIDLCENTVIGYLPNSISDWHLQVLFQKCPNLEVIHGLHTFKIERSRLRKSNGLSVPGVLDAISVCSKLKRIETSNYKILEALSHSNPQISLEGVFRNRDGVFPPEPSQVIKLSPFLRLTCLYLLGVMVTELSPMPELEELHLQWVTFSRLHPFRSFSAVKLKCFVMKQCIGPVFPLRYYPLFIALGYAPGLSRLEIVRVPILGGMILRSAEEGIRNQGFMQMKKLVFSECRGVTESDLGQLMIASSSSLKTVKIQASLTKDSLVAALHFAGCRFPNVKSLHLGYTDVNNGTEVFSAETLLNMGLPEVPDVPASLTDSGLKTISQLFPNVMNLTITNCPHTVNPKDWIPDGVNNMWNKLKYLAIDRCHCIRLSLFTSFLPKLPSLEVLLLLNMFREPPKGCSHVGLSAGTGLGLSSAIVSNQDEHIAVQGHHVEAVPEIDLRDELLGGVNHQAFDNEPHEQHRRAGCMMLDDDDQQLDHNRAYQPPLPGGSRDELPRCYSSRMRCRPRRTGKCSVMTRYRIKLDNTSSSSSDSDTSFSSISSESSSSSSHSSNLSNDFSSPQYVGPITRRRSQMMTDTKSPAPEKVSCSGKVAVRVPCVPQKRSHRSYPTKKKRNKKSAVKPKILKSNKATTPPNPFYEEDVIQVLPVTCPNLISFTIIKCGISDIRVENCPNLKFIAVQLCRILKHIQIKETPDLTKVEVIHCSKFHIQCLATEVLNLYNENPVLVHIIPNLATIQPYSSSKMEEFIFSNANSNHSVIVIHNEDKIGKSMPYEENLLNWLQFSSVLLNAINPEALTKKGFMGFAQDFREPFTLRELIAAQDNPVKLAFPWGHKLHRIIGKSSVGSYELLTNNPLFSLLWRERKNSIAEPWAENSVAGLARLPDSLSYEVADMVELKSSIGKHHVGFYINVENCGFNE